jgi:hypothetical protein
VCFPIVYCCAYARCAVYVLQTFLGEVLLACLEVLHDIQVSKLLTIITLLVAEHFNTVHRVYSCAAITCRHASVCLALDAALTDMKCCCLLLFVDSLQIESMTWINNNWTQVCYYIIYYI